MEKKHKTKHANGTRPGRKNGIEKPCGHKPDLTAWRFTSGMASKRWKQW